MLSLGSLLLALNFFGASAIGLEAPRRLDEHGAQPAVPVVPLGTAGNYAILTKSGVTTTGATSVTGDIGTSPIASTAITGFTLTWKDQYSTSALVHDGKGGFGSVKSASHASPTPSQMTTAISDMETAYTDAAGRVNPHFTNVNGGLIEGETLTPGLHKWGSNVGFTSSLTFAGTDPVEGSDLDDVWILQISGNVIVGSGAIVTLTGGAKAENIFWQVAGSTTLHTTAHMEGIILCATHIVFQTGSSLNGAALAQTAVTLDATTIVKPS